MSQSNKLTEAELRQRLAEVEAVLSALRSGKADMLIGDAGPLLFQLRSAVQEQERLQREAERIAREWATTFDALEEAIWILDVDHRVLRANKAAEKVFGCPLAEMLRRRCFDIVHHTGEPIPGCPFCRMRTSRRRESLEIQLGERWYNITTDPLLDESGNLIGAVHIARDITDKKHAEEKVRESEETYRNLFQNAQVGLYRTRISDGKILESNEQLARMFGYDNREEFIAEYVTSHNYVDPGTRERMLHEIQKNGTIKNFEARFYRKDGSIFWARYSARIYPEKGWIEGVAEDVTEHKLAEAALRENERRLATLMANLPGMAYRCQNRPDWPMEFVSEGCANLTGWPASALLQNRPAYGGLIVESDRRLVWDTVQQALAARQPFELTYRIQTADGQIRWVWERGCGVFAPDGSLLYLEGFITDVTKLVQAEDELRRERSLLERIAMVSPAGIVMVDRHGQITFANPQAGQILGLTKEAITQRSYNDPAWHITDLHGGPFPDEELPFRRVMATGQPVTDIRHAIEWPDGRRVLLSINGAPLFDASGELEGAVFTVSDITERVKAEAALRHLSARHEAILAAVPEILMEVNMEHVYTWANQAGINFFGDDVIGKEAAYYFVGDQNTYDTVQPLLNGREDLVYVESWQRRRDGEKRLLAWLCRTLKDERGNVTGALSCARDITEMRRTEAALRESEERFRRLFENSLVGIYRTTPDGRILLANPTLVKMLRYPSFEALAQINLEKEGFHPQYPRQLFKEAIEREGVVRGLESAWICADGTTIYVRESAQAVRGPDGHVAYYEGVVEDITEQRQLEARLRQSQKLEAIGQLAGGVAHDFNNILSVIIMQTDLMDLEKGLCDTAKEGLRQIRTAAERAANLTRQLLLFSRRQIMQPRDLDLNDVVTNLTKMLQRIIGEDVHMELRLHPAPLMIRADVGMLDQVLMNLAVNARDAMPEGGRLIIETSTCVFTAAEAATLPDVKPGRYVSFKVTDTGHGIPLEIMPQIFDPFFTTKEPGKGTGLGLATVFGIVKQHAGGIRVASEPGRGTTFEVYLPAMTEVAVAETTEAKSCPSPRGGTETILLVEDDPAVRLLTRTTLEGHGYRVLEAADGTTALALWQQHRDAISLLLTDMVMPGGLNGRDLACRLRADRPELKVIYTSGYSAEMANGMLNHEESEAFLQKPCTPTHLLETVRRCLDAPAGGSFH